MHIMECLQSLHPSDKSTQAWLSTRNPLAPGPTRALLPNPSCKTPHLQVRYSARHRSQKGRSSSGASQLPPNRALLTLQVCPNTTLHLKCLSHIKCKPSTTRGRGVAIQGKVRPRLPSELVTSSPGFKNHPEMQVVLTEGNKRNQVPPAATSANKHPFTI